MSQSSGDTSEQAGATQAASSGGTSASDKRPIMIEADKLCKYYGRFSAVESVSFQIRKGEVVAFLGPNGAGKSTTMKLLTGYLAPSSGVARLCGFDMNTNRLAAAGKLGYLPENGPLYPDMTPMGILKFFARARGLSHKTKDRIDHVIGQCDLSTVVNKPIGKLSRGYRQRTGMALTLLHEPDVLILDEPTAGLDPNQIREVRETIRKLGETKTILLSTHILQEVEQMASRILLVDEGRIKYDGSTAEFAKNNQSLDECFQEMTTARN